VLYLTLRSGEEPEPASKLLVHYSPRRASHHPFSSCRVIGDSTVDRSVHAGRAHVVKGLSYVPLRDEEYGAQRDSWTLPAVITGP